MLNIKKAYEKAEKFNDNLKEKFNMEDVEMGTLKSSIDDKFYEDCDCKCSEPCECARVSLSHLMDMTLHCKQELIKPNVNKQEIYHTLSSIEFSIVQLNDENNHIDRDL